VRAPTYQGVSWGAVTLLQAVEAEGGRLKVPRMRVQDEPAHPYRGLLVDVARRYHSVDVLKQVVQLCRLYKLNYLQLHLTDDQSFTFPSRAFPQINSSQRHGGPTYSLEELRELVRFADERGVTIVPEMDIPGHAATLVRTMPELFKISGTEPYEHHATLNFASPAALAAIDTLIGEILDVFRSSPYFHIGGDEADISNVHQHRDFQAAFTRLGLGEKGQHELFRYFLNQMNAMVKARGKQMIVWEGFGRDPQSRFPVDKDILVMQFENAYYLPEDLLGDGYTLVNASWTPLYVVNRHVWPARKVYEWDLGLFGRFSKLYPTTVWFRPKDVRSVIGAQVCSWEGPETIEIQNLRRVVPAMAERVWNPQAGPYERFARRLGVTDRLLERLVHPVTISHGPLDASDPNGFDVPCFSEPLSIILRASSPGTLRYTLDGSAPTGTSPVYREPIRATTTTTVRAALFDERGTRLGYESGAMFYHVPPSRPNLATRKAVTASGGTQGPQLPELAVDDNLDLASSWWAGPWPQWLQADLGAVHRVGRIEVFPYWDGRRYYQYTVEVSVDGRTWSVVADRSQNTVPSSEQGDSIVLSPTEARYVRVNMLRNSANEGVHLVELRVWPAPSE
jgi:hexosaminidase